jgi:hypothetical protein
MKIVTYNFLTGGAGKEHWSQLSNAFAPDIILAQESYPPQECGMADAWTNQIVWHKASNNRWGTAVYVKSGQVTSLPTGTFQGWLTGVEVEGCPGMQGRRLRAFSLHAPPRRITGKNYSATVNDMLTLIGTVRGDTDLVIGGDFNLLSLGRRHESEKRENGKRWTTRKQELAILKRVEDEFGLVNCWQKASPAIPLAQTLRWVAKDAVAYHCDGIFVPSTWQVARCTVEDRVGIGQKSGQNIGQQNRNRE